MYMYLTACVTVALFLPVKLYTLIPNVVVAFKTYVSCASFTGCSK